MLVRVQHQSGRTERPHSGQEHQGSEGSAGPDSFGANSCAQEHCRALGSVGGESGFTLGSLWQVWVHPE